MSVTNLKSIAIIAAFSLLFSCNKEEEDIDTITEVVTSDCDASTGVDKIVCLANNYLGTLSTTQQTTSVNSLNLTNAKKWSNLPENGSTRLGLKFSALSSTQLLAAKALLAEVMGNTTDQGYNQFIQTTLSDDNLSAAAGGPYGSGNYVIGFLGTPSTTGKWMLQVGGHHYAANVTFDAGEVVSITPSHQGVEPITFTTSGTTYTPMATERAVMADMLASFTKDELAAAKISTVFSDCLLVPGSTSNTFPATKLGVKVSALSSTAQAKVLAAMDPWLDDLNESTAANYKARYTADLADTYVTYSGNSSGLSGTSSSFFTANADYVRIDGPGIWIEFICQTGVVYPSLIHYHSVYRDHDQDYIGL
ncbi:uncharacterized protein DUF3500 [Dyadobacter jejuensis]|uniref:Uncharacterized protein DUF3500 n=1 Tax=Dyadobacter jejuensis TaxID=1082580 RepID=A0A316APX8_9BACT|nr:DUF3500 domain-containing protein [Dyadobacter jejuensis]PWJ59319.1 uncharacterized protein DUF3500 [Dyadobacter jejuensis]